MKTHIGALLLGVWGPQVYLSTAFARKDIVLHGALQVVVHGCWLVLCCLLEDVVGPDQEQQQWLNGGRGGESVAWEGREQDAGQGEGIYAVWAVLFLRWRGVEGELGERVEEAGLESVNP